MKKLCNFESSNIQKVLFMRLVFPIFFLFLFLNCSVKRSNLIGEYHYDGPYDVYEKIAINKDSTFVFEWFAGLAGNGITTGKWELKDKYLRLVSDIQPENNPDYYLLNELIKTNDSIEIKIFDNLGEVVAANCTTYLDENLNQHSVSDLNGIVKFPKHNFNKIFVSFVGYNDIVFYPKSEASNFFEFQMKEKTRFIYFINEKWKVKKGKLQSEKSNYTVDYLLKK